jgi:trimeric autotransporter adhesin
MKRILLASLVLAQIVACTKKTETPPTPPPVVVTVPERLELTPTSGSAIIGGTVQFTAKYFNTAGVEAPVPAGATWSSTNTAIATVNQTGLVTAVATGNASIKITLNTASATVPFTVVANPNQLATINITPNTAQDITIGQTVLLTAAGANAAGGAVGGLTFGWASSSTSAVTIMPTGMATAVGYGAANITASANGVTSGTTTINVVRQGNFSGAGSAGTAKLKIDNGVLKLSTSTNFFVSSSPPDLRIYLSANSNNISNSVLISNLTSIGQTSGARTWNIPTNVTISQYRYVLVWCAQVGGAYGVADLGM